MDVFQRKYTAYYSMMYITGLWPFDNSNFTKVQRTFFSIVPFGCVIVQLTTLVLTEYSMKNLVAVLTFGCPIMLSGLRYIGFLSCLPTMRFIYDSLQTDCNELKNPIELEILMNHIKSSRRVVLIYFLVCLCSFFFVFTLLSLPILLNYVAPRNESWPRYVKDFGFLVEEGKYSDLVSWQIILASITGFSGIACTESTLTVLAYYICGLFKITGYRITKAVNLAAEQFLVSKHNAISHACFCEAAEIHRRSINIVNMVITATTVSYLVAIPMAILSFGCNLYRVFIAISEMNNAKEIFLSSLNLLLHLVIMFLNNYSGQKVIDYSVDVFYETCESMWYRTPISMQKLILMIMKRSMIKCEFNLSGLFVPCYNGFSMMMSTAFSYFTMLQSMK